MGAFDDFDSYLAEMTLRDKPHQGVLFQQAPAKVQPLHDLDSLVHYGEVTDIEARPLYQILAQVYDLQNYCHLLADAESRDPERLKAHHKLNRRLMEYNTRAKRQYSALVVAKKVGQSSPT
jgi:hypothetical protein